MARMTRYGTRSGKPSQCRDCARLRDRMRPAALAFVLTLAGAHVVFAQSEAIPSDPPTVDGRVFTANEPARALKAGRVLHAGRIVGDAPTIDGRLSEEIWSAADVATDFIQRDPDNGKPMTEATRVQVVYD